MARHSLTQRLLMVAGSTSLAAGGVLLPTSAFAAPAPQSDGIGTMAAAEQGDHGREDAEWVKTTDSSTGISFKLPGKATIEEIVKDDISYAARSYSVTTADESTTITVNDGPTLSEDLDLQLQFTLRADNADPGDDLKATDIKKTAVDGHAVLDARVTNPADADYVAFVRIISDEAHVVKVVTETSAGDDQAGSRTQQKARDSVRFPGP
ncbi:hypothetical protein [Streptomyces sp. NPDC026673]|uniref:hypothetical protein n=1 Tax=Streptomyces sp. NPDC026673 TaxID=3155724 RepID=UPI00340F9DE5